jgi:hypothetical protein
VILSNSAELEFRPPVSFAYYRDIILTTSHNLPCWL